MFFLITTFNESKLNGSEPLLFPCWLIASPYFFFNWSMAWAVVLVDAILPSRKQLAMSGAFWATLTGVQKLWTSKLQRAGMLLRFLPVTGFLFVITVNIQAQTSSLLKLKTFGTIVFLFRSSPPRNWLLSPAALLLLLLPGSQVSSPVFILSSLGGEGCLIFHFYFLM